ncbi:MAG: hypothetical protein D6B27_10885 [Gammaproteobacteria bacterium]|nr:MAG: hypothetical protein D6B27_10885 [Gammaproteobacteria bacterium]
MKTIITIALLIISQTFFITIAQAESIDASLKYVGLSGDGSAILIIDRDIKNYSCNGNILEIAADTTHFDLYYKTALLAWQKKSKINLQFSGCSAKGHPTIKNGVAADFFLVGNNYKKFSPAIMAF